ncbi:hypothetical protein EON65_44895 [archaeon]|nr:MAG: hypothetical protein EON65_44895 [archaeon]
MNVLIWFRLARLQQTGQMVYKPSRNPLNAERSPRGEFKGFSFDPPPATPEKDRWNYPESDWGLMAKFSSQKVSQTITYVVFLSIISHIKHSSPLMLDTGHIRCHLRTQSQSKRD